MPPVIAVSGVKVWNYVPSLTNVKPVPLNGKERNETNSQHSAPGTVVFRWLGQLTNFLARLCHLSDKQPKIGSSTLSISYWRTRCSVAVSKRLVNSATKCHVITINCSRLRFMRHYSWHCCRYNSFIGLVSHKRLYSRRGKTGTSEWTTSHSSAVICVCFRNY